MMNRSSLPLAIAVFALVGWLRGAASPGGSNIVTSSQAATAADRQAVAAAHVQAAGGTGAGQGTARSGSAGKKTRAAAGPSTSSPCPDPNAEGAGWRGPLRLYEEFFGLPPDCHLERSPAIRRLLNEVHARQRDGERPEERDYQLKFMVALVPDPIDAQLPMAFDQAVDAIQQGFAFSSRSRLSYLQDRTWIPWNDDQAVKSRGWRRTPGALLFRRVQWRQDGRPEVQLMGVFLVGESPKTGINQTAFRESLQLVEDLSGGVAQGPLLVLGPTYSGSAMSLRVGLQAWTSRHRGRTNAQAAGPRRWHAVRACRRSHGS